MILAGFFLIANCFGQKKILTEEYVSKQFNVVSSGEHSPEKDRLLLVCYNKYFNLERFPQDFRSKYNLNAIKYKSNMAVEIFTGKGKGLVSNLKIDKIEENKTNIRIYYSFDLVDGNDLTNNPFIIAETPKARKPVVFYENGDEVKLSNTKIYTGSK